MAPRPTRLFIIKFLGLWGGSNAPIRSGGDDHKDKPIVDKSYPLDIYQSDNSTNALLSDGINNSIERSSKKVIGLLLEQGIPGLTVCVSKKGETLWEGAFGYCDVENQLMCEPDARMRIASISKPLFAATVVGPLVEQKKLDIRSSIHQYLKPEEFPRQKYRDKEYDITFEQLLSHTSGIRHYIEFKPEESPLKPIGSNESKKIYQSNEQFNREGFYQRQTFRNVIDALRPFKEGPLVNEPGTYKYTTYGYTLLSAATQKVLQKTDEKLKSEQVEDFWMKVLRRDWNLQDSCLDQDEVIIPKRARYYLRTSFNGGLINAPYTDISGKWAGGGVISTTKDLVKFGNALINCYKGKEDAKLKRETIELLWKEVKDSYALGFKVKSTDDGRERVVFHEGGALGASSVLIIYPDSEIVVAMLANLGSVSLRQVGLFIADEFKKLK